MLTKNQVRKIQKASGDDKALSETFDALSDPGRLQIFKVLLEREDVCVSDIASILAVSVPAASRQLTILERAGLIERVRRGQMICFQVQKQNNVVKSIIRIIKKGRSS